MKYSIVVKSALSLRICVGEFETFKEAKAQMKNYIVELISHQQDEFFNAWDNLKEDFSEEIQEVLDSFEETGTANIDGELDDDSVTYYSDDRTFEISGKYNELGYNLAIDTNAINMYDPDENYYFTLTEGYEGGGNELTIELLVNNGGVNVFDMISDDVRSRLGEIDLDEE